jgi:hypothetical protein
MTLKDRNTIKMVAEHWCCTPRTVRNRVADGTLACLRIGGVVRITREQVEACEAACNTESKLDQQRERMDHARQALAVRLAVEAARRQRAETK